MCLIVFYMIMGESCRFVISVCLLLFFFLDQSELAYRYTSLGGTDNTLPNPSLANSARACGYDQAWKLRDGRCERNGRVVRS